MRDGSRTRLGWAGLDWTGLVFHECTMGGKKVIRGVLCGSGSANYAWVAHEASHARCVVGEGIYTEHMKREVRGGEDV